MDQKDPNVESLLFFFGLHKFWTEVITGSYDLIITITRIGAFPEPSGFFSIVQNVVHHSNAYLIGLTSVKCRFDRSPWCTHIWRVSYYRSNVEYTFWQESISKKMVFAPMEHVWECFENIASLSFQSRWILLLYTLKVSKRKEKTHGTCNSLNIILLISAL